MIKNKLIFTALIVAIALFVLTGCKAQSTIEAGTPIFFLNKNETGIVSHSFDIEEQDTEAKINKMLELLAQIPKKLEYTPPLAMGFSINSVSITNNRVSIDVSREYTKLSTTTEVLVRAAIVKTIVQLPEVRYVAITVDGETLTDVTGNQIGWMSEKTFIYNDGNAINTYDEVIVKLYFANEDGDKLIGAYRDKFYSTNVPLELFVVEELISGPSGQIEGLFPTINSETNIISVSTSDGVCYVNLDSSFLSMPGNVTAEAAIYSIVDSLIELPGITKVQILVNGEIPAICTSSSYEKNTDIITILGTSGEENVIIEVEGGNDSQ